MIMQPDSTYLAIRTLAAKVDSLSLKLSNDPDVVSNPIWVVASIFFTLLVLVVAKLNLVKHKHITEKPESAFDYIIATLKRHYVEYAAFFILPLVAGWVLRINVFSLWAIWGFLITTLSAFYAARADYSSNQAMISANQALQGAQSAYDEARRTHNAVIQFADNLEMFVDKVKYELDFLQKVDTRISIKFLTVIPVFGAVGLETIYQKRKAADDQFKDFHSFLCDIIKNRSLSEKSVWNLEILTHQHEQTKEWLTNIYEATEKDTTKRTAKVNEKYLEQKKFVSAFATSLPPNLRRMRFWDPSKLPNIETITNGTSKPKIPFQFLLVKRFVPFENEDAVDRNVDDFHSALKDQDILKMFFLFSGDFLYDFVFKILEHKVDMTSLQGLTKGYYTEDKELTKVFNNIFWNFSKNMPTLVENNPQAYYP